MEESPADYVKENTRLADPGDGEKIMEIVRQISFLSKFPVSILSESFIPSTAKCEKKSLLFPSIPFPYYESLL